MGIVLMIGGGGFGIFKGFLIPGIDALPWEEFIIFFGGTGGTLVGVSTGSILTEFVLIVYKDNSPWKLFVLGLSSVI